MDDELQASPIRGEHGVGAGIRDIGPPLAVGNRDFGDLEGIVPKKLNRLNHRDLVRVTCSAPVIRFGLPKPKETVRVTAVPQQGRDYKREYQWVFGGLDHVEGDSA